MAERYNLNYGKYDSGLRIKEPSVKKSQTVLRSYGTQELGSFMDGIAQISDILEHERPDIIVAPLRGSAPIVWSLEAYNHTVNRTNIPTLFIPTGNNTDIYAGKRRMDLEKWEYRSIAHDYLRTYEEVYPGAEINKVIVLDESKIGHSITAVARQIIKVFDYRSLEKNLKTPEIILVKAQDCKTTPLTGRKKDVAKLKSYDILMNMPQIDESRLLPTIYAQSPDVRTGECYSRHELLEVVDNTGAKKAYQDMIYANQFAKQIIG